MSKHAGHQLCAAAVGVVVLQEELPGLLIERGLGVRVDEQALDGDEDVRDAVRRLPVLLERVHTDLSRGRHIRVEYFCGKPALSVLYYFTVVI